MMNKVVLQTVIALPAIGRHLAAGDDVVPDKRQQLSGTTVVNHLQSKATELATLSLNSDGDLAFMLGTTAAFTAMFAAQIELIGLNLSRQGLAVRNDGASSEFQQPTPSGLIICLALFLALVSFSDCRLVP
jgi:hypothetical protein